VSRFRGTSKAPLAVAGILSVPLFFVGLMAFSLKVDKPSHHVTKRGTLVLGDPTKATVGTIYLLAFAVSGAVVVVGVLAVLLHRRLANIVPAAAAIVASVLLLLPLDTWASEHTSRYPLGVDNIRPQSQYDLVLRGEWEQNAKTTAHQIGLATIGLAIAAILITVLLEIRRRRDIAGPPVRTPPDVVTGGAGLIAGRATEPPL
jgi:heme A synthase